MFNHTNSCYACIHFRSVIFQYNVKINTPLSGQIQNSIYCRNRWKIDIPNTYIHYYPISWLDTGTSTKVAGYCSLMRQYSDACKPHGRPYISVLINHPQSKLLVRCVNVIKKNHLNLWLTCFLLTEIFYSLLKRFEDTKEDIESCKSRDEQYSGQQKKKGKITKKQAAIYKTLHRILRSSNTKPTRVLMCTGLVCQASLVASVVLLQLQTGDKKKMNGGKEREENRVLSNTNYT